MKMKLLVLLVLALPCSAFAASKTYGLHLFFDEREFVDVLSLKNEAGGPLSGHMSVPNDFEGDLLNLKLEGNELGFDLFVPKNSSRPQDLVFHYQGRYFDQAQRQIIGYVTLKDQPDFVASFVAFLRE